MEHTELYSQQLAKGKRTYIFDVKQTEQNDLYIKITERKLCNNGFEHHRVLLFEESIEDFMVSFTQCLAHYHKLKEAQFIGRKPDTYSEIKKEHANAYQPWTTDDDVRLESLCGEGKTVTELSVIFERKIGAIESRIKKLGLKEKY